jgi:hypothetical protein
MTSYSPNDPAALAAPPSSPRNFVGWGWRSRATPSLSPAVGTPSAGMQGEQQPQVMSIDEFARSPLMGPTTQEARSPVEYQGSMRDPELVRRYEQYLGRGPVQNLAGQNVRPNEAYESFLRNPSSYGGGQFISALLGSGLGQVLGLGSSGAPMGYGSPMSYGSPYATLGGYSPYGMRSYSGYSPYSSMGYGSPFGSSYGGSRFEMMGGYSPYGMMGGYSPYGMMGGYGYPMMGSYGYPMMGGYNPYGFGGMMGGLGSMFGSSASSASSGSSEASPYGSPL